MTDRKNPEQDLEDFMRGDDDLSKLYREARGSASPNPETDDRILSMAREEVRKPAARRPRWIQPLALAATAVLSLSVLLNIWRNPETREAAVPAALPDRIESSPPPADPQRRVSADAGDRTASGERSKSELGKEALQGRSVSPPPAAEPVGPQSAKAPAEAPSPADGALESKPGSLRKPWASQEDAFVADPPYLADESTAGAQQSLDSMTSSQGEAAADESPESLSRAPAAAASEQTITVPEAQGLPAPLQNSRARLEQQAAEADQTAETKKAGPAADSRAAGAAEPQRVPSTRPETAPTPEQRVDEIRKLIEQGRHTDALNLLHLLRIESPGFELPPDLKAYIGGEQRAPSPP